MLRYFNYGKHLYLMALVTVSERNIITESSTYISLMS